MKSVFPRVKRLLKEDKAVFGLTSVQKFFAIILGVALLAYVIVVIMGTLSSSTLLPAGTLTSRVVNESSFINSSGDLLSFNSNNVPGYGNPTVIVAINGSSGTIIPSTNYTLNSGGTLFNSSTSPIVWQNVNVTYSYTYNTPTVNNANSILRNTSGGITSFFASINPVYAILAILVIILVLVVLVRVVTGGANPSSRTEPQL